MQIFNYSETGLFLSNGQADPCPIKEGDWLFPALSTTIAPPACETGEVAVFDAASQSWSKQLLSTTSTESEPVVMSLDAIKSAAIRKVRTLRRTVFSTLGGIQAQCLADEDLATAKAISAIQNALKDLPGTDLSACTTEAEVNSAFTAAWYAIAVTAPVAVQSAFNEVLSGL